MAQKIVMLGGRRAGKSTILASIVGQLSSQNHKGLCVFEEVIKDDMDGLYLKTRELQGIMQRKRVPNAEFMVDMTPGNAINNYLLRCSLNYQQSVEFDFYDAPGEAMLPPNKNAKDAEGNLVFPNYETNLTYLRLLEQHNELKALIPDTEVFIIVIDTPFLMEAPNQTQNKIYNRIDEINRLLTENIRFNDEFKTVDKKLILFCPVKCEKWVHSGRIDAVNAKIRKEYNQIISRCLLDPRFEMYILPIETAGNLEFSSFKEAMTLNRHEPDHNEPESCAVEGNMVILRDGKRMIKKDTYTIEPDTSRWYYIDFNAIPQEWYKVINDASYAPKNCEQVAYYIMRFLVNKEMYIMTLKHAAKSLIERFILMCKYKATFGTRIKEYVYLVEQLKAMNLIKENKEGICKILN